MTKLTTHVLDVYSGKPGKGIKVELFFLDGKDREKLTSITLNNDGRSDMPLVEKEKFQNGKYELIFYIGDYFKKITQIDKLKFLDDVVIIKERKSDQAKRDQYKKGLKALVDKVNNLNRLSISDDMNKEGIDEIFDNMLKAIEEGRKKISELN